MSRWPLALGAAALLLGSAASVIATGSGEWLSGGLAALGGACVGAWINDEGKKS
jgi:hypothetical protein